MELDFLIILGGGGIGRKISDISIFNFGNHIVCTHAHKVKIIIFKKLPERLNLKYECHQV